MLYKNRQENDDMAPSSKIQVTGKEFSLKLPIIILLVIRRERERERELAEKDRDADGMVDGEAIYPGREVGTRICIKLYFSALRAHVYCAREATPSQPPYTHQPLYSR
jgi:hypothetical protein